MNLVSAAAGMTPSPFPLSCDLYFESELLSKVAELGIHFPIENSAIT